VPELHETENSFSELFIFRVTSFLKQSKLYYTKTDVAYTKLPTAFLEVH